MRILTAVFVGTLILSNVLAKEIKKHEGQKQEGQEELEKLLSKEELDKVVGDVKEIIHFALKVVSLSIKVILQGLNSPGNLNLVLLSASIINMLKKLIQQKVQLYGYLIGRALEEILPNGLFDAVKAHIG